MIRVFGRIRRRVDVDHVVRIPNQRPNYPTRTGELLLQGVASDEIVVKPDTVLPSEFYGTAIPGTNIIAFDVEGSGTGGHARFELREILGQVVVEISRAGSQ